MNSKRKSRAIPGRSPRPRGPDRNVAAEGVYNNSLFMHSITGHIGNTVIITTQNGQAYEGIFRTFSSQFEIVIEMAHKVDEARPSSFDPRTVVDKLIFRPQDILSISLRNVDLEFATKDTFQTDTAISKFNGQVGERELEPWEGPGCNGDEFELDGATANGWDVNDMFKKNEQMYGVTSTFDHSMPGYTTQIQRGDSTDYRDAEARATKIANEIENNPTYKARLELENGDEEERFAAVARPANNDNGSSDKYVPPAKRKHNQQTGKASGGATTRTSMPPPPPPPQVPVATTVAAAATTAATHHTKQTNHHHHHHHHGQPPPTPPPPPATATLSSSSAASSSTSSSSSSSSASSPVTVAQQQARTNGNAPLPDSTSASSAPKPQRTTSSIRSGRSYNVSTDVGSSRYEALSVQQQQQQQAARAGATSSSNPDKTTATAAAAAAPSTQAANAAATPAADNHRISSRTMRGREEQLNELKSFSSDFKLSETAEDQTKSTSVPAAAAPNDVNSEQTSSAAKDSTSTPDVDKMTSTLKKSNLNPNAKEFVYNPNAKPFVARSPSTPTPSRPHTPQTPSWSQATPPLPPPHATMVMPAAYVVTTAQPAYNATPNQPNRFRKVPLSMPHRPDIASQMQVAAATGQPLLAPAPMHTHAQFTMPYSPQGHINPQPYQQMVRMVTAQQGSGAMVPLVSTAINYHHDTGTGGPGPGPQMQFIGPHPHHSHHSHHGHGHGHAHGHGHSHSHPPPGASPAAAGVAAAGQSGGQSSGGGGYQTAQSPATGNSGAGSSGGSGSNSGYGAPPPMPPPHQGPPHTPPTHTFPMLCPILPAAPPPPPGPHHIMAAAAAAAAHGAQATMQQVQGYIHHHHNGPVGSQQPHHIQVIIPHSQ
ncbi:hypothetical protein LSTR_LSTR005617 [Laodelphax striatellus]|uniref:LsmAD domain-containing protein n=1 Tax=Laodelphax striatellus TaxID=195883 RepID=A0A482WUK5_LAOST|nr:hypothetical protein LSTR_LSTR005617 [Laodelphax striatellus]